MRLSVCASLLVILLFGAGMAGFKYLDMKATAKLKEEGITIQAISTAYDCQADGWSRDECIAMTVLK